MGVYAAAEDAAVLEGPGEVGKYIAQIMHRIGRRFQRLARTGRDDFSHADGPHRAGAGEFQRRLDMDIRYVGVECVGDGSALGDGACDDGNDDVLPVNFNCEKWGFDGAECICEDENNSEYDCWDKTSPGYYDCPSEGVIRGGDCSD